LYLGDTARVPYGSRSPETVLRYAQCVAGHLANRGVKALVIACNTATSYALKELKEAAERESIPVIGVIEPGAIDAVQSSPGQNIGIIGTEGTIRGKKYEEALRRLSPEVSIYTQACPLLVPLIEEGWLDDSVTKEVLSRYLAPFKEGPDTLIMGCTHYPLITPLIQDFLPDIQLINSAYATAKVCKSELAKLSLLRNKSTKGSYHLLATDNLEKFRKMSYYFLGSLSTSFDLVDLNESDLERFQL
jgi:glutamate racemase